MPAALKDDASRLHDANEIIRKQNAAAVDLKRTIEALRRENDTAEKIRAELYGLSEHNPEPPDWLSRREAKPGKRGGPITIWSDFHYGETIQKDQTGGVNEYNMKIAKKRFTRLVDTTIDLSFNHMGRADTQYPGIVVMLGGDMIGGDIHEELLATNDRTSHQSVNDLTDMLAAGIDNLATKFGKVYATGVVGNHGRSTKKMMMKNRVYTNYDWSIYCNLARYFRKEKNIRIDVPNSADAFVNVYGHRYMLTHGDSIGVKGGDGIIGAIGPIMRGSLKVGQSQAQMGRAFDTLCLCHWHQYITLPGLIVNNALKGFDEYAMLALRAKYSRPSQALWFTHPEHGITAHWQVYLEGMKHAEEAKKNWVTVWE
jgi:hypothetical protein